MSLKKAFAEVNGMYLPAAQIDCDVIGSDPEARADVFGGPQNRGRLAAFLEENRGAFVGLKGIQRVEEGETAALLRRTIREIVESPEADVIFHDGDFRVAPIHYFLDRKM